MYIDILILSALLDRPHHGYEIKQKIAHRMGNDIALNNNLLYPTLKRHEKSGAVRKTVMVQKGKPNRTVYHITPLGRKTLKRIILDFTPATANNRKEFIVRAAFMGILSPAERRQILAVRKDTLLGRGSHLAQVDGMVSGKMLPYFRSVALFLEKQIKLEIEWISELERMK